VPIRPKGTQQSINQRFRFLPLYRQNSQSSE
jgi:hypothetical protein